MRLLPVSAARQGIQGLLIGLQMVIFQWAPHEYRNPLFFALYQFGFEG